MKKIAPILPLFLAVALSGCFYTNIKLPLDEDVSTTRLGSKVGVSSMRSVGWLFAWGDAGTEAAAQNGNISTINHMDRRYFSAFFGLYTQSDTIVYGD